MDIHRQKICLFLDSLLHIAFHQQILVLAHFHILLRKRILVGHELLDCRQVLVLSPLRITGVGQNINTALLTFCKTYVQFFDDCCVHLVITRCYQLVALIVILEYPDILDCLLGGLLWIGWGFLVIPLTFSTRIYIVYQWFAYHRRLVGVKTQRHLDRLGAVSRLTEGYVCRIKFSFGARHHCQCCHNRNPKIKNPVMHFYLITFQFVSAQGVRPTHRIVKGTHRRCTRFSLCLPDI